MKKISKQLVIKNLFLILFIIAFIQIFSIFFGEKNMLIGVATITGILLWKKITFPICKKEIPLYFTILMLLVSSSVVSWIVSPAISFMVHFVALFLIMYFTSNSLLYKTYIPFILCYLFIEATPVSPSEIPLRIISLVISTVLFICVSLFYHRKEEDSSASIKNSIAVIDSHKIKFCIEFSLGISIAMLLGEFFHIDKVLWITITVMSLTQLDLEITSKKMKSRLIGTIIGCFVFMLLFEWLIPSEYVMIATLLLSYFYTFIEDYQIQMIFVTINSLNSAAILYHASTSIFLRVSFLLVGILIVSILAYSRKYLVSHKKLA